ncbi:MAG: hypothetical protein MJ103_03480 [Saccharofermentans sp.]|nr:hypothetical protein [Saccharofermentans sp.]
MEYIDKYANDVLRLCIYYLGGMEDAKEAFYQVFSEAAKANNPSRTELFGIVRSTCVADIFPDENEEDLYRFYFGLEEEEIRAILGNKAMAGV